MTVPPPADDPRDAGAGARADRGNGDPSPFPAFPVEDTARIYDSVWCGLRRDRIRLHDGSCQDYHVFEVPDAVVVVPLLADGLGGHPRAASCGHLKSGQ